MNRDLWEQWRRAKGARKQALLSQLVEENEALAKYFVNQFKTNSNYYTGNMFDDLLQAARIGIMRAIPCWDPDKGGFNNVAFNWVRHEIQQVVRHATRVSVPKSAFLPKAKQDEIARFYALNGREPEPHEVGLTQTTMTRARSADVHCVPMEVSDLERDLPEDPEEAPELDEGDIERVHDPDAPDAEGQVDRQRDVASMRAFLAKLSPRDRREFWDGTRPDLAERARRFVEGRRRVTR